MIKRNYWASIFALFMVSSVFSDEMNLATCLLGSYSDLCDHKLLNPAQAKQVEEAELRFKYDSNLAVCSRQLYSEECDSGLLSESDFYRIKHKYSGKSEQVSNEFNYKSSNATARVSGASQNSGTRVRYLDSPIDFGRRSADGYQLMGEYTQADQINRAYDELVRELDKTKSGGKYVGSYSRRLLEIEQSRNEALANVHGPEPVDSRTQKEINRRYDKYVADLKRAKRRGYEGVYSKRRTELERQRQAALAGTSIAPLEDERDREINSLKHDIVELEIEARR